MPQINHVSRLDIYMLDVFLGCVGAQGINNKACFDRKFVKKTSTILCDSDTTMSLQFSSLPLGCQEVNFITKI